MFTEMRLSQTLLQTWHDHFATIYTSSHSFLQFSGHNLKCSLTVSLYNLTIPSNHSAMNCQQSTPLFTRDTLSTFELPGTHSEYFNSLTSRTAEQSYWDRTGPAVRPVKDRTRDYSGPVHLKDRLCNRTGKNRLNRPVFYGTGEPAGSVWTVPVGARW
jgi:hypothetical protein